MRIERNLATNWTRWDKIKFGLCNITDGLVRVLTLGFYFSDFALSHSREVARKVIADAKAAREKEEQQVRAQRGRDLHTQRKSLESAVRESRREHSEYLASQRTQDVATTYYGSNADSDSSSSSSCYSSSSSDSSSSSSSSCDSGSSW